MAIVGRRQASLLLLSVPLLLLAASAVVVPQAVGAPPTRSAAHSADATAAPASWAGPARGGARPKPTLQPAIPIVKEKTRVRVALPTRKRRPAVLEVKKGKRWTTLSKGATSRKGVYTTTARFARASTIRVRAPKSKKLRPWTSRSRVVRPSGQSGDVTAAATVHVREALSLTTTFRPARSGRVTQLQVRQGAGWAVVDQGVQDAHGATVFEVAPSQVWTLELRGVTTARRWPPRRRRRPCRCR
jgi:hypothetical protein